MWEEFVNTPAFSPVFSQGWVKTGNIDTGSNVCFNFYKDYDLRDTECVANMIKYSNVVINLVGRNFSTR